MNAIEIKDLYKNYGDFSLDHISFDLPTGCILGLVGENGAGKSTAINLIMNAVVRDGGSVKVLGVDNQSKEFSAVKENVGIVLDEAYYPEVLTAKNVSDVMKYTYRNWDETYFFALLDRFGLPPKKIFRDFSRGMKMKLAIAVALSHQPELLILDEATSGLDPMIRDEILDIFNDFTRNENHSVLLSSHIVSDLEKICDYIVFLHKGKLVFCEEKDRLLEEYAMLKLTEEQFEDIPKEAVIGAKKNGFGVEALVKKSAVADVFKPEHTSLEDIILFLAKGA